MKQDCWHGEPSAVRHATAGDGPECLAFNRAGGKQACPPRRGQANPQPVANAREHGETSLEA